MINAPVTIIMNGEWFTDILQSLCLIPLHCRICFKTYLNSVECLRSWYTPHQIKRNHTWNAPAFSDHLWQVCQNSPRTADKIRKTHLCATFEGITFHSCNERTHKLNINVKGYCARHQSQAGIHFDWYKINPSLTVYFTGWEQQCYPCFISYCYKDLV